MAKVIGYVRVSTNKQDLERQKQLIKEYCQQKGYYLIGIEEDFAISGTNPERKGLEQIMAITKNKADMVVVSELSRLSRQDDIMGTLQILYNIINKVDLVLLEQADKIYKAGEQLEMIDFLSIVFKAMGASDERKKITARMRSGLEAKLVANPTMNFGHVPFGFKIIPNPNFKLGSTPKSLIAVDEKNIEIVKLVFQYIINGLSEEQVAEKLNIQGYRTEKGYKFISSTISKIVLNETYIGKRKYKDGIVETGIAPISQETWSLAHQKLAENKNYSHSRTFEMFPLKGILKCECGRNMCRSKSGKTKSLYRCADRILNGSKGTCTSSGMMVETMNNIVWEDVRYKIIDNEYIAKSNDHIAQIEAENYRLLQSIKNYEKIIEDCKVQITTIVDTLSKVTSQALIIGLNEKASKLEDEIKNTQQLISKINKEIAMNTNNIRNEAKILASKELDNISEEKKADIYRNLLDKVVYHPSGNRNGFVVIDYKNGLETVTAYYCFGNYGARVKRLPSSFKFNTNTNKVQVQYHKNNNNPFNLETEIKEYTGKEIIKEFYDTVF